MREFESGAVRDTGNGKISYAARNPIVEASWAKYMTKHSVLPDGSIRSMKNWWNGFGLDADFESLLRHVSDLEALHGGYRVFKERLKDESGCEKEVTHIIDRDYIPLSNTWKEVTVEDSVNAIRFNCGVYLLDYLKLNPFILDTM